MAHAIHQHVSREMRECSRHCGECHDICLETIQYCLHQGGPHAGPHHIRLMADCVEICQTSRDFLLRGSDMHYHTCKACAAVCVRCAEDCEKMGDDTQMHKCADACRKCAEMCRDMSA